MCAASQLPGKGPTDVDDAPALACYSKIWLWWLLGSYGNGEIEFQDFFYFLRTHFFQILYKTTLKMHIFQLAALKWKGALNFLDSDTCDKNWDYRTNWIEYQSHRINRFSSVFCDLYTVFFAHPLNLKGLVHIYKDDFTKFQGNSRTKCTFSNFRSFPGPRSNSRTFPSLCEPWLCLKFFGMNTGTWSTADLINKKHLCVN